MKTKKLYLCILGILMTLIILAMPILSSCGTVASASQLSVGGKHPPHLNLLNPNGYHLTFRRLIYESLVYIEADGSITPRLATAWEFDDATSTWTVNLREGVKWHDGVAFTAADVKFTYDTAMTYKKGYYDVWAKYVESVTVVDDYTIKFHLTEPLVGWIGTMREERSEIVPKHIWEGKDLAEWLNKDNPIGTGPYKYVEGDWLTYSLFEKNDDYWAGAPKMDEILYTQFENAEAWVLAFQNGDIDCISGKDMKNTAAIPHLITDPNVRLAQRQSNRYDSLRMNMYRSPNNIKEFRQAVSWAIDRQEICELVYHGYASPAAQVPFIPLALQEEEAIAWPGGGVNPATSKVYTDAERIAKANAMLDDITGVSDKPATPPANWVRTGPMGESGAIAPMEFELRIGTTATHARTAEVIQDDMADIGIKVTIKSSSFSSLFATLKNQGVSDWDWYMGGHEQPANWDSGFAMWMNDSDEWSSAFYAGAIGFDYPLIQDKMTASLTATGAARDTLIEEIQTLWADYLPLIPVHVTNLAVVYRTDRITGWDLEVQSDPPRCIEPLLWRNLIKLEPVA